MLFILRSVAIFVTLVVALALRSENLHLEEVQEVSECPEVCAAVPEAPGSYAAHGADARTLQHKLQPGDTYFAGRTCESRVADASVVPWIPPQEDPVTKSYIAVYIDPLLPHLLGPATEGQLCASRNGAATCLCQLRGHQALGVVGALASVLPASKSLLELQLAMQRRCPAQVPNLLAATVLTLLALVALLCAEAAWSWRKEDEELEQKAAKSDLIHIKPAFQNFKSGISWLLGFVTSLSALQTGALLVVEKSCDVEAAVWLVAATPAFLALAAAMHFISLLGKQQLVHAYLQHGQMLVDLPATIYLDKLLFLFLMIYGLLVVFSLGLTLAAIAIPALAGPCWALLQAINASRDIEKMQHLVLTDLGKLGQESHQIRMLPWVSMLDAARSGRLDRGDAMTSDAKPRAFGPGDIAWHRHLLRRLTGSSSGFLVIPGFFGVLATSWIISAVHMASYACAKGELTHLRLASSDAVVFQPWQPKYNAAMDVSFQQVAVQAMSAPSRTTRISFMQPMKPSEATETVTNYSIVEEFSAPTEEIQLSHRMVPRVATITVDGLRSSLPTTGYEIRFSPLVTLPVLLQLTAPNFAKKVAWSTLPGSILSVPAGLEELQIEVFLADFVVGVPEADPKNVPAETLLWTGFEAKTNQSCADSCRRHLNCLSFYDGHDGQGAGCFFAFGNRSNLENGKGPPFRPAHGRSVRGRMQGCRAAEPSQDLCAAPAEVQDSLKFNGFFPDWRSMSTSLIFELHIEAGEQEHDAEVTTIELQQGPPIPIDVIGILVGEMEGGSAILLKSNTFVDTHRKITVDVSEYQPLELKNLRLLLLPILPDHDFEVHWSSAAPAAAEDREYVENSAKCRSPLLRARYKVCGAPLHGQLDDQPRKFELNPLTGQPEQAITFEVRPKIPGSWELTPAPHKVDIRFVGVDSPIAWAAQQEGCITLQNASAAVAASADAACHLLRNCTDPPCQLMDRTSFGGDHDRGLSPLGERGLMQAMVCHLEVCRKEYTWRFRDDMFLLEDHSVRVSLNVFLEILSKPGGLQFIRKLIGGEQGGELLHGLAKGVWAIPFHAATIEALANLSEAMPRILFEQWVTSRGTLPETAAELRSLEAVFDPLDSLDLSLTDPEQLERVAVAVPLARKLKILKLNCAGCSALPLPWPNWCGGERLEMLQMANFNLRQAFEAPRQGHCQGGAAHGLNNLTKLSLLTCQIQTLPKEVFQHLIKLKTLALRGNQIWTLPKEIFQNLTELDVLDLRNNQIRTMPKEVFQHLIKLKTLGLQGNQIRTLPKEIFQNLTELDALYLSDNQIRTLPKDIFQNLTELDALDLRKNQIHTLCKEVFQHLIKLKTLGLRSNLMRTLPKEIFQSLTELEVLDLCNNQIHTLPKEIFQNLAELNTLGLEGNQIQALPKEVFQHLSNLERLDLRDNRPGLARPAVCEEQEGLCFGP